MFRWFLKAFAKPVEKERKEKRAEQLTKDADKWESGELGESEKHAIVKRAKELHDRLVSISKKMQAAIDNTEREKILEEVDHPGLKHQQGRSLRNLNTCHPDIQLVAKATLLEFDAIVIEGWRDKATQQSYVEEGTSWINFPLSYHNSRTKHIKAPYRPKGKSNGSPCSLAMDITPFPVDWGDTKRFEQLAKIIKKNAKKFDIPIEHGYDLWKKDRPHWQISSYRDDSKLKP